MTVCLGRSREPIVPNSHGEILLSSAYLPNYVISLMPEPCSGVYSCLLKIIHGNSGKAYEVDPLSEKTRTSKKRERDDSTWLVNLKWVGVKKTLTLLSGLIGGAVSTKVLNFLPSAWLTDAQGSSPRMGFDVRRKVTSHLYLHVCAAVFVFRTPFTM